MIRHIVFFSARRPEDLPAIRDGLRLLGEIPHVRRFQVADNRKVDPLGNDIDLVVYGEFDNDMALAAYKAHPLYAEATARVRPLRELRFSADFLAG